MDTIYNLQKRAETLRGKTETDSITPEEVGGLHFDTLAYIADMEQSADGLGIRKVYKTTAAMEADTAPTGTNGKALRYGQLVCIYDEANPTAAGSGDIYAWQKPGWLLMGNISRIYELKNDIDAEAKARQDADSALQQAINKEAAARQSADTALAGNVETEANSRATGDDTLQKNIDAEAKERQDADNTLQGNIDKEATARQSADTKILGVADNALGGATARFSRIVESGTVNPVSVPNVTEVVYIQSAKVFAGVWSGGFCNNWSTADLYMDGTRSSILKDKAYVCGDTLYVWSDEEDDLVKASGGGSGNGFYNVTQLHPLGSGYYTKETAVAALADADIDDADKPGMVITIEVAAGKWEDYRFCGTDVDTFLEDSAWERYGGADAIKKIRVTRGTATEEKLPDEQGEVAIDIPQVEVDQSVNENSTNPVSGKAVSAAINEKASTYGTAL